MDNLQNNELMLRVLQRLEQNESRLTEVSQQLSQLVHRATPEEAANAEDESARDGPEPEAAGRLVVFTTLSALIATLVMVIISLFQAYLDPGGAANAGMAAAFNRELVQNINYGQLYSQYRAYTDYLAQSELQSQLERTLASTGTDADEGAAEDPALAQELAQAQRKAAASRLFFSMRYLDRNGNYDTERQLGEAWARAEQQTDLEPAPHFADADQQRTTGMQFIWLLLWLTAALCVYEVIHYFNERRLVLRGTLVLAATFCLLLVIAGVYLFR